MLSKRNMTASAAMQKRLPARYLKALLQLSQKCADENKKVDDVWKRFRPNDQNNSEE